MAWKKKKKLQGKNRYYSVSKKLRNEFKSNDEFEIMLNNLSLEDIIALKLELASKSAGGCLYGLPLWRSLRYITEDAVLKYTLSATRTRVEAMRFLGMLPIEYRRIKQIYEHEKYFEEENAEES
tara:strand:+ start:3681 stop:4052 length:372 start_codon:yes stop_codon:yes gene_type:complete